MTFGDYIPRWKRYARKDVCKSWKSTQDGLLKNHVAPILGATKLSEIDSFSISDVILSVREKGLSSQTERHIYRLLNAVFRDATKKPFLLIEKNPVDPDLHRSKFTNKLPEYLNPEDAWDLIDIVTGDYSYGLIAFLQLLGGLRVGEAIGVRIEDIDFFGNVIHIGNVWNKNDCKFQDHTKNKSTHVVPMIPELRAYIQKYLSISGRKSGFLAIRSDGEHVGYTGYRKWLRAISLNGRDLAVPSHGLRHSCVEIWMAAGASDLQVQDLLNHTTLRSTERYKHGAKGHAKRVASKVVRQEAAVKSEDKKAA